MNKDEVTVRFANADDIDSLIKIRVNQIKEEWGKQYNCQNEKSFIETTNLFMREHINNDMFFFLALLNDRIVSVCGIQLLKVIPYYAQTGIEGYVFGVYTVPEYRKKGIATHLLKNAIQFAEDSKASKVRLNSDNEVAIKIYRKIGFKKDKLSYIMYLES